MLNRMRKFTEEREQGFTLIELLVVIIIIGILAAIAIPVFLNQRKKGVDASLKSDLKNIATSVETLATDGTVVPAAAATIPVDAKVTKNNKASITGDGNGAYCIRVEATGSSQGAAKFMYYDSAKGGLITPFDGSVPAGLCTTGTFGAVVTG